MNKFKKIWSAIKTRKVGYGISRELFRFFERRRRDLQPFAKSYVFDNRQRGCDNLLLVLMGFQPVYWDVILDRVNRNISQFDEPIDVCLCVPCGLNNEVWGKVQRLAENYGFSSLYIYDDLLAQAQNTAIKLHPHAQWIYKIDEDIILSDHYLQKLKQKYRRVENES